MLYIIRPYASNTETKKFIKNLLYPSLVTS